MAAPRAFRLQILVLWPLHRYLCIRTWDHCQSKCTGKRDPGLRENASAMTASVEQKAIRRTAAAFANEHLTALATAPYPTSLGHHRPLQTLLMLSSAAEPPRKQTAAPHPAGPSHSPADKQSIRLESSDCFIEYINIKEKL